MLLQPCVFLSKWKMGWAYFKAVIFFWKKGALGWYPLNKKVGKEIAGYYKKNKHKLQSASILVETQNIFLSLSLAVCQDWVSLIS